MVMRCVVVRTGDFASASMYFESIRGKGGKRKTTDSTVTAAACSLGVAVGNAKLASHIGALVGGLPPL